MNQGQGTRFWIELYLRQGNSREGAGENQVHEWKTGWPPVPLSQEAPLDGHDFRFFQCRPITALPTQRT
jgi:hypothetical protein